MEKILQVLCTAIDSGRLVKIIFAGKRKKSIEYKKITLRPVTIKGEYMFQAEFHYDKKVTHENIPYYEAVSFAERTVAEDFKQVNILTESEDIQIWHQNRTDPRSPDMLLRAVPESFRTTAENNTSSRTAYRATF